MKDENIYTDYCKQCTILGMELDCRSVKFQDCITCYTSLHNNMEQTDIIMKYKKR